MFCAEAATAEGVTANQLTRLAREGVIERLLPRTYRMVAAGTSPEQRLRVALLWASPDAAVAGRSAAERYGLEGVRATRPEIVVPARTRARTDFAKVYFGERRALMIRSVDGLPTTGDAAADYDHDNEKWSVPARCGYRIVFATWDAVTRRPDHLVAELGAALAAG